MEIIIHAFSTAGFLPSAETSGMRQCKQYKTWRVASFSFVARDPMPQKTFTVSFLIHKTSQ